uniref:EGF-like domain-containing protein n=1 Tax=Populus alba TaxID=43335 RepID=A0A4U5NNB8_POPAL|nr:hypothetical protein D5086_0000258560 [Populus alba]
MSLRRESLLLFITIIAIFIATISPTTKAQTSGSNCASSCGFGKSARVVPYPFGFSDGCPILLNCESTEGEIKIGEFQVQNITPNGILVNLPADCNRSIETISSLFGPNYGPSSKNSLLLQNCSNPSNSCVISTSSFQGELHSKNCEAAKNDSLSCYSLPYSGIDTLSYEGVNSTQCRSVFSSLALGSDSPVVSFQLERIELEWWIEGHCRDNFCSKNGNCSQVKLQNGSVGFRCHCHDGFAGDGFNTGNGCRRVSKCNASRYMSGHCGGTTRVVVLIGGLIAGASLMAVFALLCYFVRKKSTSMRNRSSAKRLLFEAAGNYSVPFFQYKEIERATNGFSEKQRLGTGAYGTVYAGKLHNDDLKVVDFSRPHSEVNLAALAIDRIGRGCVDEIVDPYLDPNRDAWTLSSIHSVAELAFRCLAFHRDMRPSMMEVAEELEQIRLSAWTPTMYMASPSSSSHFSDHGSQKSLGVSVGKKAVVASRRLLVPQRADSLTSLEEVKYSSPVSVQDPWLSEEVKYSSPVSVQDPWLSEQSSPSTNSLLGNVVH